MGEGEQSTGAPQIPPFEPIIPVDPNLAPIDQVVNFEPLFSDGKLDIRLENGLNVVGERLDGPDGHHFVIWHKNITSANVPEAVSGVRRAIGNIPWGDRWRISMSGVGDIFPYGNPVLDKEEAEVFADVIGRHEGAHLVPILSVGRTGSIRFVFKPITDTSAFRFVHAAARLETFDSANPLTLGEQIKRCEGPETLEGLPLGDDDILIIRTCKALLKKYPPETPFNEINDEFVALKAKLKLT